MFRVSGAAEVAVVLVSLAEHAPAGVGGKPTPLSEVGAGMVVLAAVLGAWQRRPERLLELARRALSPADPRKLRPRREQAYLLGTAGLGRRWTAQALVLAAGPLLTALLLDVVQGQPLWLLAGLGCSQGLGWWLQYWVLASVKGVVADSILRGAYPLHRGPGEAVR